MESKDWAQYCIEDTAGLSKPWLPIQWLLRLQDQQVTLDPQTCLAQLHQALMTLGDWWQGRESIVFGTEKPSGERS